MRRLSRTALVGLSLLAAGCGSEGSGRPDADARLILDFQPNAVHAGIYSALARDFDEAEGVSLQVEVPGSTTDAVKLLLQGRADFAILDIHDLAIAAEQGRGRDLVAVMALVQQPLAAVLAAPRISRPRDLEGERAGVSGLPSDVAVLETAVRGDGGDPAKVKRTTIGFTAVQSLLSGKVAAATAFWNAEGVALRARKPGFREFRVDRFGAPAYPELVVVTSRAAHENDPDVARALAAALRRGYEATQSDPDSSIADMTAEVDGLDPEQLGRELSAVAPAFTAGAEHFGELDDERLRAWAKWEAQVGITKRPPDVDALFDKDAAKPRD